MCEYVTDVALYSFHTLWLTMDSFLKANINAAEAEISHLHYPDMGVLCS